jgi:putative transposase
LEQKINTYQQIGESISQFDPCEKLTTLKQEYPWLKEVNAQSLQEMTRNFETTFTKFFREKTRFPKFKSKKNPVQSFPIPQNYKVYFEKGIIKLPKIGEVEAIIHRRFQGILKTATLSTSPTGKYYISILIDREKELPVRQKFFRLTTIGIDVGLTDFAVISTGEKVKNPKYLQNALQRLKCLQKRMSKKVKGSNNRNK